MCGIVGIYNLRKKDISDAEFDVLVDSLKHRGPDGRGIYKDKTVPFRLGHRRLSILDLSLNAKQPMCYSNQRYWISFNGEIYNFIEIRKELESLGYKFKSESDTEVILASFLHWGKECQYKFNGMWVFGIWDALEKKLFLSRDRFGVKPLFYYYDDEQFIFASETKTFWYVKNLNLEYNFENVTKGLQYPGLLESTDQTLLKHVYRVKPGHYLTLSQDGKLECSRWWNTLDHLETPPENEQDKIQKFYELFENACLIRMRSDVPLASALSGGMDSSSIVATMYQIRNQKKQFQRIPKDWNATFTALLPKPYNEYYYAKEMVNHFNTNSFFQEINSVQMLNEMETILFHNEELFDVPIGGWLIYQNMKKEGYSISIDGHGGDELLGGYHHQIEEVMNVNQMNSLKQIRHLFSMRKVIKSLYGKSLPDHHRASQFLVKILKKNRYSNAIINYLLKFKKRNIQNRPEQSWLKINVSQDDLRENYLNHNRFQSFDPLTKILYRDFHFGSLPWILRNFDYCSMAHGVEIRSPFLDHRIVTLMFSMPDKIKAHKGYTKYILRKAMQNLMPETVRLRKDKIGLANPMLELVKKDLKSYILDNISSKFFYESPIWEGKKIKEYVEQGYKDNNYSSVIDSWKYINASNIMRIYTSKKFIS
ncbi:MAG: Asparagine synthetase [glutamine-hydrolyzing] 1 [Candidatus Anoxychlamydiales bacterium]|nr:Asparagine synthetase [glutamine-hydrolyzing] 1 [Candidatus Anoxychlamydiales bacterium]NGX35214.1 Asparagine synthetase [glutamine-hydrolyzing] 1 [Candidatus Anoxychlamydiales bacterium]